MVLLKLADVSGPPQIVIVDKANGFVVGIGWCVLDVSIEPLVVISMS